MPGIVLGWPNGFSEQLPTQIARPAIHRTTTDGQQTTALNIMTAQSM
jgi:hypothetical protein